MPEAILRKVAAAMTTGDTGGNGNIPAGYTYLGQFVDHDLTFDHTTVALGDSVSPADLLQGRSPALDLDSAVRRSVPPTRSRRSSTGTTGT